MAEAKLTGESFDEVWSDYRSEADVMDVNSFGSLCGMTTDQIAEATSENIRIAEGYMVRAEVWRAVLALADKKFGRTSGRVAACIIVRALASSEERPGLGSAGKPLALLVSSPTYSTITPSRHLPSFSPSASTRCDGPCRGIEQCCFLTSAREAQRIANNPFRHLRACTHKSPNHVRFRANRTLQASSGRRRHLAISSSFLTPRISATARAEETPVRKWRL
jgi:hypothetical protein